jgi:hypothetical protein
LKQDARELPQDPDGDDPVAFAANGPLLEEIHANMDKLLMGFLRYARNQ